MLPTETLTFTRFISPLPAPCGRAPCAAVVGVDHTKPENCCGQGGYRRGKQESFRQREGFRSDRSALPIARWLLD